MGGLFCKPEEQIPDHFKGNKMKTIIIVRHAKSCWKDLSLYDFGRPLNKRGKKNAPFMGKKLKERQIIPDIILSSPAKRAGKTAKVIAKAMGYPKKKILFDDNMYYVNEASYLFEIVESLDGENETAMLIGHNPSCTEFTNIMLEKNRIDNIPTMGVCCIKFNVDSWKNVLPNQGELVFFDYPKRYQDPKLHQDETDVGTGSK